MDSQLIAIDLSRTTKTAYHRVDIIVVLTSSGPLPLVRSQLRILVLDLARASCYPSVTPPVIVRIRTCPAIGTIFRLGNAAGSSWCIFVCGLRPTQQFCTFASLLHEATLLFHANLHGVITYSGRRAVLYHSVGSPRLSLLSSPPRPFSSTCTCACVQRPNLAI
jgi:hypothetical protein